MITDTKPLGRRWSSPEMAPLAARALIKHSMNATRAARELRPHLTEQSARKTGSRMIHTPAVIAELQNLLNNDGPSERNFQRFLDTLWDHLERLNNAVASGAKVPREILRLGIVAANLLARIYRKEMIAMSQPATLCIDGLDEGLRNLTGMELSADPLSVRDCPKLSTK